MNLAEGKSVHTDRRNEFNWVFKQSLQFCSSPSTIPANNLTTRTMCTMYKCRRSRFIVVLNACCRCHSPSLTLPIWNSVCIGWNSSRIHDYAWTYHIWTAWLTDGTFLYSLSYIFKLLCTNLVLVPTTNKHDVYTKRMKFKAECVRAKTTTKKVYEYTLCFFCLNSLGWSTSLYSSDTIQ